jgi:chloride channel protein, CIC family
VLEAGNRSPVIAYPDESLHDAVARMVGNDIGRLPVVARDDPRHIVGYVERRSIMAARLYRHREEHELETGWLGRPRKQALSQ